MLAILQNGIIGTARDRGRTGKYCISVFDLHFLTLSQVLRVALQLTERVLMATLQPEQGPENHKLEKLVKQTNN